MTDEHYSREVAQRAFATEFNHSTETIQGDGERAPIRQVLRTGELAGRVYVVGTVTDVEDIGDGSPFVRARVYGATDTFYVYAGQYQPEALQALEALDTPEYVAVVGKPRTYETDDGDVNVSIKSVESVTVVDADTRDQWVRETAQRTFDRIQRFAEVVEGDANADKGIQRALDVYGQDVGEYYDAAIEACEELVEQTDDVGEQDMDAGPAVGEPDTTSREALREAVAESGYGLDLTDVPGIGEAVAEQLRDAGCQDTVTLALAWASDDLNDEIADALSAIPGNHRERANAAIEAFYTDLLEPKVGDTPEQAGVTADGDGAVPA